MAKCYLCGKESKVEITVEAYNHKEHICGVCALDNGIIKDPSIAELIREAEGLPQGKACMDCKHISKKRKKINCKLYNVPLDENSIKGNYCDCFERLRK